MLTDFEPLYVKQREPGILGLACHFHSLTTKQENDKLAYKHIHLYAGTLLSVLKVCNGFFGKLPERM